MQKKMVVSFTLPHGSKNVELFLDKLSGLSLYVQIRDLFISCIDDGKRYPYYFTLSYYFASSLHIFQYLLKKFPSPITLLPQHNDALDLYFGASSSIA